MSKPLTSHLGRLTLTFWSVWLTGCATSMSGIGAGSEFTCKAPDGVSCMSVTGVNANADKGNLPALLQTHTHDRAHDDASKAGAFASSSSSAGGAIPLVTPFTADSSSLRISPAFMDAPYSGPPLLTPARVLRVWVAPFEDEQADLHDQHFLYIVVNNARWAIEANQTAIKAQFRQVHPLRAVDKDSSTPAKQSK